MRKKTKGLLMLLTVSIMQSGMTATAWAQTTVEYQNLGELIQNGNETIRQLTESTEEKRNDYTEFRNYLIDEKGSIRLDKKEAHEKGETEEEEEYAQLEAVYQSAVKSLRKNLESLDSKSTNQEKTNQIKTLTASAQSLMISWQTLSEQEEYLETTKEWYESQLDTAALEEAAGIATLSDKEKAQQNLDAAIGNLETVQVSATQAKESLCELLGLESSETEFAEIPAPDEERISRMDLEADTKKALEYNTSMISARDENTGGSTVGIKKKDRTMQELESEIRIQMQELYETVKQDQTAYKAAAAGYQAAEITWANAQKQYDIGMISRSGYLQAKVTYQQKKASYHAASLSLLQSIETYEWAVQGQMSLEE